MKCKKESKKCGGLSIRFMVFVYLLAFSAAMLGVLWYFQVVHLDEFYEQAKQREFSEAIRIVNEQYGVGSLEESAKQIAEDYDIQLHVVDTTGNILVSSNPHDKGTSNEAERMFYDAIFSETKKQGGELNYMVDDHEFEEAALPGNMNFLQGPNGGAHPTGYNPRESLTKDQRRMVYAHVVTNAAGEEELIYLSMLMTPVDATIYTLRKQYVYIAILFFLIAIGTGFAISTIVSRPIQKINRSAKHLAEGDFDTEFSGTGYREIKELSDTLNYAAEELGRTEKLRRDLIANVSHDLRTPLTMITAYSEVMRDLPGENTPENAQIIIDETTRLTTLVNDMLDLSKLQAGVMELDLKTFDFTRNILLTMNRFAKLKEQDGYDIRFEFEDAVMVTADEYKIYQVVYNLIINAINYAGEDKQVIVRQIVKDDLVRLEVQDHGRGIEDEELKNIWDRYYKVEQTHKRAVQGTGLGLSIVQNILKMHEANFGVESQIDQGTTFWFELKIAEEE